MAYFGVFNNSYTITVEKLSKTECLGDLDTDECIIWKLTLKCNRVSTRRTVLPGPSCCPVRDSYNTILNLCVSRKLDKFLASWWSLTFARKRLLYGIVWLIGQGIQEQQRNVIIEKDLMTVECRPCSRHDWFLTGPLAERLLAIAVQVPRVDRYWWRATASVSF